MCERFLVPVPAPARTDDARLAALRFGFAYHLANGRIIGARGCTADERRLYAGANGAGPKRAVHAGVRRAQPGRMFVKTKGPRK